MMADPPRRRRTTEALSPDVQRGIIRSISTILQAVNSETPTVRQEGRGVLNAFLSDAAAQPAMLEYSRSVLLAPGRFNIPYDTPPDIFARIFDESLADIEQTIDPEHFTTRQIAAYREVKPLIQKLYNESISTEAAAREAYEKDIGEVRQRAINVARATGTIPLNEAMVLDAMDHPAKYNLRVVTEARPQGHPPATPARRGRPPSVTLPPTVTRTAAVPSEITKPLAGEQVTAGRLLPAQPTPVPTGAVVNAYVNSMRVLLRTDKRAFDQYVRALQTMYALPSTSEAHRRDIAAALATFGIQPEVKTEETTVTPTSELESYLQGGTNGGDALYRELLTLMERPTEENTRRLDAIMTRLKELAQQDTPEGATSMYVLSRFGMAPTPTTTVATAAPVAQAPAVLPRPARVSTGPPVVIPENAPEDIKNEIRMLAAVFNTSEVSFRAVVNRLIDDLATEYRKNPVGYMNSRPAIILSAFSIYPPPSLLQLIER